MPRMVHAQPQKLGALGVLIASQTARDRDHAWQRNWKLGCVSTCCIPSIRPGALARSSDCQFPMWFFFFFATKLISSRMEVMSHMPYSTAQESIHCRMNIK